MGLDEFCCRTMGSEHVGSYPADTLMQRNGAGGSFLDFPEEILWSGAFKTCSGRSNLVFFMRIAAADGGERGIHRARAQKQAQCVSGHPCSASVGIENEHAVDDFHTIHQPALHQVTCPFAVQCAAVFPCGVIEDGDARVVLAVLFQLCEIHPKFGHFGHVAAFGKIFFEHVSHVIPVSTESDGELSAEKNMNLSAGLFCTIAHSPDNILKMLLMNTIVFCNGDDVHRRCNNGLRQLVCRHSMPVASLFIAIGMQVQIGEHRGHIEEGNCSCYVPIGQEQSTDACYADVMAQLQTAIIAAGCFWGVEETFRTTEGVLTTEVGYTGGHTKHPSYEDVCTGTTGHAEAVRMTFDPDIISYAKILDVFWNCHNPTQGMRQGPDIGSQYRSAIFVLDDMQRRVAEESKRKEDASARHNKPITTEITDATEFWRAEEYHQKYAQKHGGASCHI